jgi:hypothetical protein
MLLNLKKICGHKLSASDGDIGHVKDFFFDDQTWAVRYLVADTGTWLPGRQVLLSPYAFGGFDEAGKKLDVNLTRKQIESSPPIDSHRPVSRQYEENYYGYYGFPVYWQGGSTWGASDYPVATRSVPRGSSGAYEYAGWDDIHLRSAKAVHGFKIHALDGEIGTVCGFLVDDKRWVIRELVVETGHWYSGKEITICASKVSRIGFEENQVFVNLARADIRRAAEKEAVRPAA